ncbi:MAG: FixH family protein [Gracilimonas sp.]|nr:FixH family protein [Gracilimonas sp.]
MTKLKPFGLIMAMAVLVFAANSCDTTDNSEPQLDLIPINSVTVDGYAVSVESEKELETGSNELYWKIEQDGEIIKPQSISITPMMDMGEMMHSTPYTKPQIAEEDGRYFNNMVVFIMPGGMMGSWSLNFEATLQNEEVISGSIPIDVASSWRLTSVQDKNDNVYFITWHEPKTPVTGENDLKFLVHTRESMMSFPAVDDLKMSIYPYMDMGGGNGHSTEFSNPEATQNGYYEGSINYSMSGTWTTSVELIAENDTLPEVVFEYSVRAE